MHRFYVTKEQIHNEQITITGPDVNHIKNVLRMGPGDELIICNGQGKDCYCIIELVSEKNILAKIVSIQDTGTELMANITLFQGLPKKDKMELIIQKAVELGVYEIVPVMTNRVIVKIEDDKKKKKKLERWKAIAESAAKQSRRGIIPKIHPIVSFEKALQLGSSLDFGILPYENEKGIKYTKEVMNQIGQYKSIGVYIGPEGGFDESEVIAAQNHGIKPITLGRRILRTETAGLAVLSMMMLSLEDDAN